MARVARIAGGTGLVIAGVLMLVLPGPGIITVLAGLALLAKDVPALARLEGRIRERFVRKEDEESTST